MCVCVWLRACVCVWLCACVRVSVRLSGSVRPCAGACGGTPRRQVRVRSSGRCRCWGAPGGHRAGRSGGGRRPGTRGHSSRRRLARGGRRRFALRARVRARLRLLRCYSVVRRRLGLGRRLLDRLPLRRLPLSLRLGRRRLLGRPALRRSRLGFRHHLGLESRSLLRCPPLHLHPLRLRLRVRLPLGRRLHRLHGGRRLHRRIRLRLLEAKHLLHLVHRVLRLLLLGWSCTHGCDRRRGRCARAQHGACAGAAEPAALVGWSGGRRARRGRRRDTLHDGRPTPAQARAGAVRARAPGVGGTTASGRVGEPRLAAVVRPLCASCETEDAFTSSSSARAWSLVDAWAASASECFASDLYSAASAPP
mmetsp:Transcript_15717/g.42590  ORF Transcript_15717/g.42590 Transcript_15717/m.42590 type:complete len:364 (-) Transcript_15717:15-1106(-)